MYYKSESWKLVLGHNIDNCGSFVVIERLQKLSVPEDGGNLLEYEQVLKSVGRMFVDLINGVDSIQAERDSSNASADSLGMTKFIL